MGASLVLRKHTAFFHAPTCPAAGLQPFHPKCWVLHTRVEGHKGSEANKGPYMLNYCKNKHLFLLFIRYNQCHETCLSSKSQGLLEIPRLKSDTMPLFQPPGRPPQKASTVPQALQKTSPTKLPPGLLLRPPTSPAAFQHPERTDGLPHLSNQFAALTLFHTITHHLVVAHDGRPSAQGRHHWGGSEPD